VSSPLGPATYLLRNARRTLPLIGVIVLAVMLISGIVSIMNSIPLSIRTTYGYSKGYLGLTPRGNTEMTPVLRQVVERESPVPLGNVMVCRASETTVKSIVGPWRFVVLALGPEDMKAYVEGRWPAQDAPEAVVSEPVLRNLGKRLGDVLLGPDDPDAYSPMPVKIVGVLHMQPWAMLVPLDYHRQHHFPPVDLLIVTARNPAEQGRLDQWAYERFKGEQARVFAFFLLEKETDEMFRILYAILNVVIGLLVVVITLMMGMLINIYQSQRVQEFALLQALGYTRRWLLRRVLGETALVVAVGWIAGVVCAFGLLTVVKAVLMDPRAFMLDPWDSTAYLYTVPVPIAIFVVAAATVALRLRRFDPVGIVERRLV
jgi:hypothetical protein